MEKQEKPPNPVEVLLANMAEGAEDPKVRAWARRLLEHGETSEGVVARTPAKKPATVPYGTVDR